MLAIALVVVKCTSRPHHSHLELMSFPPCRTHLAYIHPRLFTDVILLDPIIQLTPPQIGIRGSPPGMLNYTLFAQDVFPSRAAAEAATKASPEFRRFDPRVLDLMLMHGFRALPTLLHPDLPYGANAADPPVTPTSTKHASAWSQIRENFAARKPDGRLHVDRTSHADIDPLAASIPFYRPEPPSMWHRLSELRPGALFLLAEKTFIKIDELREGIKKAGTGIGGSGGAIDGRVEEHLLLGRSHLFPFEDPKGGAEAIGEYLGRAMARFQRDEQQWQATRVGRSRRDDVHVSDTWMELLTPPKTFRKSGAGKPKL